ncbi:MAG TPA: bifunctional YncE family protein/alkaline phosphatase family protein [Candidatus Kryptonia bacterium]
MKKILYFFLVDLIMSALCVAQTPGEANNRYLLPNGWWLSPAGHSIALGDLPLNAAVSPDGKYLAVTHGGVSKPVLMLVDLTNEKVVQSIQLRDSWLGIAFQGKKLFVSGGNQNCVYTFDLDHGELHDSSAIKFADPVPKSTAWAAGLDVYKHTLAVVFRGDSTLRYYDLGNKKILTAKLDGMPYYCKYTRDGILLVSIWGSKKVEAFSSKKLLYNFRTGDHPTEICLSPSGMFAYVANSNDNSVTVFNLETRKVTATVSTALYPDSPEGSTTNSVCATSDGRFMLAANADNNSVAIINVSKPNSPTPVGFIPVGWYPTKVMIVPGKKHDEEGTILVLNGKGERSYANPQHQYIGTLLKGTLSFIDFPIGRESSKYTQQVYANTPYRPSVSKEAGFEPGNPVPNKVGVASPIKYIFYFIKENRTYDQVFGDIKQGNGDTSLVMFGETVTPNLHKLVTSFVLLDNLYADAEVSADGHNWSTAAYATDYVEKSWPSNYGGRGAPYDFEGEEKTAAPTSGYIWDDCAKHGVTLRDYGEFVDSDPDNPGLDRPNQKVLAENFDPAYKGWDLEYSDLDRYKAWEKDFDSLVNIGKLPQFNIIRLPNDHTSGTRKGTLTPQAMVAQNDYALGMFVDKISHSSAWSQSAIFVIEDDAQNGADHVDAHRTEALVLGPFVKRNFVDHTLYSTSSILRTMELILGLPPMSQYDVAANPMFDSFTPSPDTSSYTVVQPLIDLNAKNKAGEYGQNLMKKMNFKVADAVPDRLFNEILWKAIKGTEMPAPRYSIISGGN